MESFKNSNAENAEHAEIRNLNSFLISAFFAFSALKKFYVYG